MDRNIKLTLKKSEVEVICNSLKFLTENVEFKNKHFLTTAQLALLIKKIYKCVDKKPQFLKHNGINEITKGWK